MQKEQARQVLRHVGHLSDLLNKQKGRHAGSRLRDGLRGCGQPSIPCAKKERNGIRILQLQLQGSIHRAPRTSRNAGTSTNDYGLNFTFLVVISARTGSPS